MRYFITAYLIIGFINAGFAWSFWNTEFCILKADHRPVTSLALFAWPATLPLHIYKDIYTKYDWQVPFVEIKGECK